MKLGDLIKRRRDELKLSRAGLASRMESRGLPLPETTLRYWEEGGRRSDTDWNPDFINALADALEMDALEMLDALGFPVIPPGFTLDDLIIAQRLRELPEDKRRQAIRMLNAIIDEL